MAEALEKLNHNPIFLSAVADDLFGRELMLQFELMKIDNSRIKICSNKSNSSAIYSALLTHSGECLFGLGDMSIHGEIDCDYVRQHDDVIGAASLVVLDANIPAQTISAVLHICKHSGTPVWFEPTEIRKARKLLQIPKDNLETVCFISPNINELQSIVDESRKTEVDADSSREWSFRESIPPHFTKSPEELKLITECFQVLPNLEVVLLTKGSQGIVVTFKAEQDIQGLGSFSYPPPQIMDPADIVSVSGAGDCLNAGFISGILRNISWRQCAQLGTLCAHHSLLSMKNVPDEFILPANFQ